MEERLTKGHPALFSGKGPLKPSEPFWAVLPLPDPLARQIGHVSQRRGA